MQLTAKILAIATLALPLTAIATPVATNLNDIFGATGYVDAEGRDWMPNGEFVLGNAGTWSYMTSHCDATTGLCATQWNSPQWADLAEVQQLFAEITGLPAAAHSNDGTAAIAIQSVLGDTFAVGGNSDYSGITRDAGLVEVAVRYDPFVAGFPLTGAGGYSIGSCQPPQGCSDASFTGFTFVAVPEPATLGLMALGVVAIDVARRRRIKPVH